MTAPDPVQPIQTGHPQVSAGLYNRRFANPDVDQELLIERQPDAVVLCNQNRVLALVEYT